MNVYEYSLHAVGIIPGECLVEETHNPRIDTAIDRIRCTNCGITGPLASEWSPPIKRAVLAEAKLEAVG